MGVSDLYNCFQCVAYFHYVIRGKSVSPSACRAQENHSITLPSQVCFTPARALTHRSMWGLIFLYAFPVPAPLPQSMAFAQSTPAKKMFSQTPPPLPVFISQVCYNAVPQTGSLNNRKLLSGGWKSKTKVSAGLVPSEGCGEESILCLFPSSQVGFAGCLWPPWHMEASP